MSSADRRGFLSRSLATAAALGTAARGAADAVGVAVVGVNGMGLFHTRTLAARKDVRLVALCDPDPGALARAAKAVQDAGGGKPDLVSDFRTLLDRKAIEAVVVATPHHWHVPIALRVMQAGKDVYLEKPASHVFREGRLLVEAEKKYRRVVQHGTQMRSSEVTAKAAEVLAAGTLGVVKMAKAWNVQRQPEPKAAPDGKAPAGVDYDLWQGPAPERAFNPLRFHRTWQVFRDYGNGDIGNDGTHDLDLARWGLGETTHPVRVTAHGSKVDLTAGVREFPDNMMVTYEYASGKVLIYEDRQWTPYGLHGVDSGNAFYGTKGYMLFSRRGYFEVYLGEKEEPGPAMGKRGRVGQPAPIHMANFLDCVRSRKVPNAPAEVAHLSCGLIHLGNIAHRVGRILRFDPKAETFPGDREATALLTKEYRKPWGLPGG
jgi:predicted dehydrogenase